MNASNMLPPRHHHSVGSNLQMPPAFIGAITTAWLLLMVAILILNVPVVYIFHATEQLISSRRKYIASMLASDIMLAMIIPLRIAGLNGRLSSSRVVCHGLQYLEQVFITVNMYMILSLSLVRNKYISYGFGFRQSPAETNTFLFLVWIISFLCSVRVDLLVGERPDHLPDVPDGFLCLSSFKNVPHVEFHEFLVDYVIPIFIVLYFSHSSSRMLSHQRLTEVAVAVHNKRDIRGVRMTLVQMSCVALLHCPKQVLIIYSYYASPATEPLFMMSEVFHLFFYAIAVSNVVVYMIFNRKSMPAFVSFMKHRRPHPDSREDDSGEQSRSDRGPSQFMSVLRKTYSTFTMKRPSTDMRKVPSPRSTRSSSGSMRTLYNLPMGGPSGGPLGESQYAVGKSDTSQKPTGHLNLSPGLSDHQDKKN